MRLPLRKPAVRQIANFKKRYYRATTMFVRFRQTGSRLPASLIETRRVDGKVRHEHIASLGSIATPLIVADRIAFWRRLHERLAKLDNRLDGEAQAKLLGVVHARIPMVTADEQRTLQLENAKADAQTWDTFSRKRADEESEQQTIKKL